ncbi:serine/threonine-protein kinase [Leifsonia shinshuensis]|uniref:Serine/threonine protein kinase n=1 Tax=Leifsonia shinshuensis TaxID=150026 RepID=A0A853CYM1_9MICO|nr:serine/threonine-protein kinase [Leifsonia shinshuensis]NYJ25648.1 serine/threonine protein kinase [Leifsonia shinshuensis]
MTDTPIPALLGRYRPQTIIGRGGEASVFRATDELLDREVAIKLYRSATEEQMAQFRTEQAALARLSHHGIVSLIDAGIDYSAPTDPRPFLVMELVTGNDLAATLRERTLNTEEISEIAYDIAEALEYVHANGVVHRDIKPSNVMLVTYGTTTFRARARLTDFGIAGGILASPQTEEEGKTTTGTAAYLSPEQASLKAATPASDIYSLGLVLLECFTHTVAFPGTAVDSALARLKADPSVPDDLPGGWTALLRAMTARDPAARPASATLAQAFREEVIAASGVTVAG